MSTFFTSEEWWWTKKKWVRAYFYSVLACSFIYYQIDFGDFFISFFSNLTIELSQSKVEWIYKHMSICWKLLLHMWITHRHTTIAHIQALPSTINQSKCYNITNNLLIPTNTNKANCKITSVTWSFIHIVFGSYYVSIWFACGQAVWSNWFEFERFTSIEKYFIFGEI